MKESDRECDPRRVFSKRRMGIDMSNDGGRLGRTSQQGRAGHSLYENLLAEVLASEVPEEGGGEAWGDSLSPPHPTAPISPSGQMGPHPSSPGTQTLFVRGARGWESDAAGFSLFPMMGQFRAQDTPLRFLPAEAPSDPASLRLFNCTDSSM